MLTASLDLYHTTTTNGSSFYPIFTLSQGFPLLQPSPFVALPSFNVPASPF